MQTSEVLNKAADLIEERGWWHGTRGGPGFCASNAITNVREDCTDLSAYKALWTYLGGSGPRAIFDWNDSHDDECPVIEVLRATALIEAAKENAETRTPVPA